MTKPMPQEALREVEQKRLDTRRTAKDRNRLGQFATPFTLASQIAEYAKILWKNQELVRFLEPSLGSGAFYSALRTVFEPVQISQATGIELDPLLVQTARDLWSGSGLEVIEGDFTAMIPERLYNLILANPPYVRHHHLPIDQKHTLQSRVRAELGLNLNGLAGLYCYFLLFADRWLENDGLAIWLIPAEFMDVNYGETLRRYLSERVTLLHIHRALPDELQFEEALVSSAIVVFRKRTPPPDHAVCFSLGGMLAAPSQTETIALNILRDKSKWTQFPGSTKVPQLTSSASVYFRDLFEIKRGIATGANDFFTLSRSKAQQRGLPELFLHPLLPSPRYLNDLVIRSNTDGFPDLTNQDVLLDCALPREQIAKSYPTLDAYLSEGELQGLDKRYLALRRTPWYRQEQRLVAPFLCTYMGRDLGTRGPFRFFWNQSQALATNVYLLLYPTSILADALQKDEALYNEIFKRLQALDFDHLIGSGRVYGGALHKIEPRELSRAVLPGFDMFAVPKRQLSLF